MPPIRSCAIKTCKAKGDKVTFHGIPSSLKRQEKWKKALKSYLDDQIINESTVICNKHFQKSDYVTSLTGAKSLLCKSAVPSVFPVDKSNMPKKQQEVVVRPRHQSRRAASKEALKQMQILLEDENDTVEIPDDDEVIPIPVVVAPPKKKYKLTHRKSSDGNDREVLVLKSITPNITNHYVENNLELECWVEELEPCQKERNKKLEAEEKELQSKLDELIKACKGEVVYKGDLTTVIEVSEHVQKTIQAVQASINKPPIVLNSAVSTPQPGYQLVMDPRLGLIVGTVPPGNQTPTKQGKLQVASNLQTPVTPASQTTPPVNRRSRGKKQTPVAQSTPPQPSPIATRSIPASRSGSSPIGTRSAPSSISTRSAPTPINTRSAPAPVSTRSTLAPVSTRSTPAPVSTRSTPAPVSTRSTPAPGSTRSTPAPVSTRSTPAPVSTRSSPAPVSTRSVLNTKQSNKRAATQPPPAAPPATRSRRDDPSPSTPTPPATRSRPGGAAVSARPTETSVEGGLTTGTNAKQKAVVDLTSDDGRPLPDSREISFNKLQGKTFPSLVVVARPHLRVADVNSDRVKLDAKVKSVLMYAPTKFTEWLIQQGLVKSEQKCSIHASTQLKLGMYSDVSKFPYSGGYVWISECCPQRFVSVFSGSIFEGSPHPPLVILKILYHWSCQTNIQNVTQWVKVDNLYVKGMYTWLRSICSVALQTHIRQLGGSQTKVEVGVISLGTTSQDGNSRQVKVEVLGILETSTKLIRLRAIEPLADGDRNYKKRFSKILEPLVQWVHPSSIIVTDLTVDKATLHQMGFSTVVQTTSVDANNSNRTIMEYLRRIVPRMFQNTLSLLSRQIIQQFLDELVWREWFGTTSMQAFDNLIIHLAEQTRFESNQSLIVKLNRVALNPFKNWGVSANSIADSTVPAAAPSTGTKAADTTSKKRKRKEPEPPKPAPAPAAEVNRPPKSTSPDVPEQMVPLENYYYGTKDNYPPKTNVTLNMKCPFCKETFNNNIILMNHLFKHAHNVSQEGEMCRYCLTSVPTANDLLKHISTAHPSETKHDNGFVCLICETQYMNPFVLGKHMSKEHCPAELPYQCGTCGYRCSNHKQAIDHFYRQHDNGPTIQCPFCLKSTTVFSSSRNIAQNMHFFIQHLQKHQRKQYAKRCGKCNLWFVQKDVLKEHQNKMHASQRGKTGLVPWVAPRNGVMVPKSKMDKYPCDAEGINFSTLFFNVAKNLKCKECKGPMETPKHFPSFESCQNPNCQYSTCCSNAMQEHNAKCNKNSQNNIPEDKIPYEMFCICGYSSQDGNQMAKHLTVCERKSAYPSLSDAKSASVTHSMLDVLGLVRRPEETEKKQTATRSIKKITKTEPEPETIMLDEDEPAETRDLEVVAKKIKKDDANIVEENVTTAMEVGSLTKDTEKAAPTEANQESEDMTEDSRKTNKETEEINKESDTTDRDSEILDTGAETGEKQIESVKKDTDINKESEGMTENSGQINEQTEEMTKESENTNSDPEILEKNAETDKETESIEKDSELILHEPANTETIEIEKDAELARQEPANAETTEKETEPIENDSDLAQQKSATAQTMEKETESIENNSQLAQEEPQSSETIEKESESMEKDSDFAEQEPANNETIEKDSELAEQDPANDNNSVYEKEKSCEEIDDTDISMSEQDRPDDEHEPSHVDKEQQPLDQVRSEEGTEEKDIHSDNEEVEKDSIDTKETETEQDTIDAEETEVETFHTLESKNKNISLEETEQGKSQITESDDTVESSEEAKVEQSHAREADKTDLEYCLPDRVESLSTQNEEKEQETEVPQQSEDIEKSQQDNDYQSLDEKVDTPACLLGDGAATDVDSKINNKQEHDTLVSEGNTGENSNDKFEDRSVEGDVTASDTNTEQEHDTLIGEDNTGENLNDEDIINKIESEISKEQDHSACVNEFESISDKDENVPQLPEVSSPVDDLPSMLPGVYDDVSESSDNATTKYLEDSEPALNLGESEQAGSMEVEEVDNPGRVLETMDYEDISNTGLDTPTSMDTD